jgi:hypothetical protein
MGKFVSKVVFMLTALLSGCVVAPVDGQPYYGGRVVMYEPSYMWVQVKPCTPYRADGLMSWATELNDGKENRRTASMNIDEDGNVTCRSSETSSSRFNQKKVRVSNAALPQPVPASASRRR